MMNVYHGFIRFAPVGTVSPQSSVVCFELAKLRSAGQLGWLSPGGQWWFWCCRLCWQVGLQRPDSMHGRHLPAWSLSAGGKSLGVTALALAMGSRDGCLGGCCIDDRSGSQLMPGQNSGRRHSLSSFLVMLSSTPSKFCVAGFQAGLPRGCLVKSAKWFR